MSQLTVRVVDVKPHPDQATNNPGCWAVQLRVAREGRKPRTFWRWHTVRELVDRHDQPSKHDGRYVRPSNVRPTNDEIVERFWDDTFAELHGFDFKMEDE